MEEISLRTPWRWMEIMNSNQRKQGKQRKQGMLKSLDSLVFLDFLDSLMSSISSTVRGPWMQSTGQTGIQAVSQTPTQGSTMIYGIGFLPRGSRSPAGGTTVTCARQRRNARRCHHARRQTGAEPGRYRAVRFDLAGRRDALSRRPRADAVATRR